MKKSPLQVLMVIGAAGILLALGMVGCFQPVMDSPHDGAAEETASPGPSGPLLGEEDPFVFTLEVSDAGDARAAGDIDSLKNRLRQHDDFGTRNYTQVLVLDEAGSLVSFVDARDSDGSQDLTIYGINFNKEYTFLVLMGHWERERADITQLPTYVNDKAPALLAAGYTTTVPNNEPGRKIPVIMGPVHVTAAIGLAGVAGENPILGTGPAQMVELPLAGTPTVTWTIQGTGFHRLFQVKAGARDDPATPDDERDAVNCLTGGDIFSGRRLVKWSGDTPSKNDSGTLGAPSGKMADSWTFTAAVGGPHGAVNFNLDFTPVIEEKGGWKDFKDVRGGPPSKWIIRNGVNDKPQDEVTNFCETANWKTTANGNGAAVFAVKPAPEITAERVYDGTIGPNGGPIGDQVKVTGFDDAYSYQAFWKDDGDDGNEKILTFSSSELYIPEDEHNPAEAVTVEIAAGTPYFNNKLVWSDWVTVSSPSEMIHPVGGADDFSLAREKAEASGVVKHTLKVSANINMSAVTVNAPAKTITIQGGESGVVTITNNYNGPFLNIMGGEVILGNGLTISGGNPGVAVNGGTFTMNSGEISGNPGMGVILSSGTFTMSGGTISGNGDGGVEIATNGGEFTMSGGTISGNGNGGVLVANGGRFIMSGDATISGNMGLNGGVAINSNGTFTMSGGTIDGNSNNGVYVNFATFAMTGGEIKGHTGGSGVVGSGTITKSGTNGGTIYGSDEMKEDLKNAGGSIGSSSDTYGPSNPYPAP